MESFGQEIGERSGTRKILRVKAMVEIRSQTISFKVRTENLGADGLAFRSENHMVERTPLTISFNMFHAASLVSVNLQGTVVYSLLSADSFLTGIKFGAMGESDKKMINAYLASR